MLTNSAPARASKNQIGGFSVRSCSMAGSMVFWREIERNWHPKAVVWAQSKFETTSFAMVEGNASRHGGTARHWKRKSCALGRLRGRLIYE
jgi:hypothetical protein